MSDPSVSGERCPNCDLPHSSGVRCTHPWHDAEFFAGQLHTIESLQARIDTLTAALERIANVPYTTVAQTIARAALAPDDSE